MSSSHTIPRPSASLPSTLCFLGTLGPLLSRLFAAISVNNTYRMRSVLGPGFRRIQDPDGSTQNRDQYIAGIRQVHDRCRNLAYQVDSIVTAPSSAQPTTATVIVMITGDSRADTFVTWKVNWKNERYRYGHIKGKWITRIVEKQIDDRELARRHRGFRQQAEEDKLKMSGGGGGANAGQSAVATVATVAAVAAGGGPTTIIAGSSGSRLSAANTRGPATRGAFGPAQGPAASTTSSRRQPSLPSTPPRGRGKSTPSTTPARSGPDVTVYLATPSRSARRQAELITTPSDRIRGLAQILATPLIPDHETRFGAIRRAKDNDDEDDGHDQEQEDPFTSGSVQKRK